LHDGIQLWRSLFPIKKAQFSQGKATATRAQHRSVRIAQLRFFGFNELCYGPNLPGLDLTCRAWIVCRCAGFRARSFFGVEAGDTRG
jgi:hypothetical protein